MNNSIYFQLINWFKPIHSINVKNLSTDDFTSYQLEQLTKQILIPLENLFGPIHITYGFTSAELTRFIKKHSSKGTAPELDQHACHEINLNDNRICQRDGAACDFYIKGYENKMNLVAQYICKELPFDKLYYYGNNRPIHVSFNEEPLKHLQVMAVSNLSPRIPGKKAFGKDAITLSEQL